MSEVVHTINENLMNAAQLASFAIAVDIVHTFVTEIEWGCMH